MLFRSDIISNAVPIGEASLQTKKAVLWRIAYFEVGIPHTVPILLDDSMTEKSAYAVTNVNKNTLTDKDIYKYTKITKSEKVTITYSIKNLIINPNSAIIKRGNYFDIYLNLVHEKQHMDTPEDSETDKSNSEYEAYKEALNHHYFMFASDPYRNHVIKEFNIYKKIVDRRL